MERIPQSAKPYLRTAASAALTSGDDVAALAILRLITEAEPAECPAPSAPLRASPPPALPGNAGTIVNGPPRDYHYWVGVIRQSFIPFIQNSGRHRFTSAELLSWIDCRDDLVFTAGDMEINEKHQKVRWRERVTDALAACKSLGILTAEPHSKVYTIVAVRAANGASSLARCLHREGPLTNPLVEAGCSAQSAQQAQPLPIHRN